MQLTGMQRVSLGTSSRTARLVVRAGQKDDRSRKGAQFEGKTRRRGRPAWMRSPYDSPLRDGNRDRLIGLLTERAAKTLMVYLMETNVNVYGWLVTFYKENPIPKHGSWDEVSGEAFLRKLLAMPIEEAKYNTGRDSLFDNVAGCGVDPRSIAQRIMDIRTQLSEEFVQELQAIAEENSLLLRETLNTSLLSSINSLDETTDTTGVPPTTSAAAAADTKPTSTAPPSTTGSSSSSIRRQDRDRDGSSSNKVDVSLRPSFGPKNLKKPRNPLPPLSAAGGSSSSDARSLADKAAAVAALNAALRAALPPEVLASHPDLKDPTQKQQQQPQEGQEEEQKAASAAAAAAAAAAGNSDVSSEGDEAEQEQLPLEDVIAQLKRALDADVAALCSFGDVEEEEEDEESMAVAAEAPLPVPAADSAAEQPQPQQPQQQQGHHRAADACLAAVLPKGWGPRLGPGFSLLSAPRNNIVSSAKLVASSKAAAGTAALSSVDGAASTGGTGATSSTSSL